MTDPIRAAIYARISLDATGRGLGVSRQLDDCRKIARDRDWEVTDDHVYVDNSISATDRKKNRPRYNEMLEAYNRGEFEAVVCWDLDRLTRQPRQLEDWIDAAEQRGLRLTTANGEADLSTDGGRMYARIKAAVARAEVERKSARQKAAHSQRAAAGNPWKGSRRAFGFEGDGMTHHPDEADLVRGAYDSVLRGSSLTSIAADLNAGGWKTTQGSTWTPSTVSQFLQNPRNAGLLAHRDKVIGPGQWEGIVGEDKWRAVNGILTSRPLNRERNSSHLLSGLVTCGLCGTPMTAGYRSNGPRIYRCPACYKLSRNADRLDTWISLIVIERLKQPDAQDMLIDRDAPDTAALQDDIKVLRLRRDQLADDFADGAVTPGEWKRARDRIDANMKAKEEQLQVSTSAAVLAPMVNAVDADEAWGQAPVDHRRAVIRTLLDITINPTQRGAIFNPDDIDVQWRKL